MLLNGQPRPGDMTMPAEPKATHKIVDKRVPFIHEGFVKLNPAQFNAVINDCSFHRQREIVKLQVSILAKLMTTGRWLARDKIDFALLSGRLILVNGHHRGRAQVKAGVDILWTIIIHPCKTMDEVAILYHSFDTNTRKRTARNVVNAVGMSEIYGITKTMASSLYNAAPIIATRFFQTPRGSEEFHFEYNLVDRRLAVCEDFKEEAAEYGELLNFSGNKRLKQKLRSAGVVAVALVTLKHCRDQAFDFWGGLADDDGLYRGDPRKALLVDFDNRDTKGSATVSMVACAKAWNAHLRGDPLKEINIVPDTTTKIDGTDYKVRS